MIEAAPVHEGDPRSPALVIRQDDLSGEATRALLALHLAGMHAASPPGSVYALDLSGLQGPGVTVYTAWRGTEIAGVAALKTLGDGAAEVKSMRTHPDHLRCGVASALLDHLVATARAQGLNRMSLETGTGPAFEPAVTLYRSRGFVDGEVFSHYEGSAFNQFLHLAL
jgi:putative acetyltransferase